MEKPGDEDSHTTKLSSGLVSYIQESESDSEPSQLPAKSPTEKLSLQPEENETNIEKINSPIVDLDLPELKNDLTLENLFTYGCKNKCSKEMQDKLNRMLEHKRLHNINFSDMVRKKKEFKNPSIYEKLIKHLGINEKGTYFTEEYKLIRSLNKEGYYKKLGEDQMKFWQEEIKVHEEGMKAKKVSSPPP